MLSNSIGLIPNILIEEEGAITGTGSTSRLKLNDGIGLNGTSSVLKNEGSLHEAETMRIINDGLLYNNQPLQVRAAGDQGTGLVTVGGSSFPIEQW